MRIAFEGQQISVFVQFKKMKEALNVNNNQNLAKFPTLDVNLLQYSDKYFDDKYEYR